MIFAGSAGDGRWRRRAAVGTAAFVAGLAVAAATQASAQAGPEHGTRRDGIPAGSLGLVEGRRGEHDRRHREDKRGPLGCA